MEDNKQLELLTDQEKLGQYIEELSYDLKAFSHANSDIRYQIDHIKEILNKKEYEHYRPADMNTAFQKIFEYTDYINRLYTLIVDRLKANNIDLGLDDIPDDFPHSVTPYFTTFRNIKQ